MHLQRIQVPDFRVLKDVDITFEKEFVPRIFPLGSQNGGGKSTLLQLIFVLLHCSTEHDRKVFLENMLNGFKIYKNSDKRVLAVVDILDGNKEVKLNFFSYRDSYIRDLLTQNGKIVSRDYKYLKFSYLKKSEQIKNKILNQEKIIRNLEKGIARLEMLKKIENDEERNSRFREERIRLRAYGLRIPTTRLGSRYYLEEFQEETQEELEISKVNVERFYDEYKQIELALQKLYKYLQSQELIYICNYSVNENEGEEEVLLCQIDNVDFTEAESFLKKLSEKVFLAAPATQVFLFLSQKSRKSLFRDLTNDKIISQEPRKLLFRDLTNDESDKNDENKSYYSELQAVKSKLPGFFAYDFITVDLLVESFKAARDRDFRTAIETGEYGNNYKELIKDLNAILVNKQININRDLSGINFKLDRDGENIELLPEDLSHGELKRLSIYMWIKYRNIENAIVLMDEVEIAFHPDWQYQIISDLKQWAPTNQYILATHSYELCQALTPSHVKELEPKLLKKEA